MLWFVNRTLHLFGWALVVEIDDDGTITNAYPARTRFRGFTPDYETEGFRKLSGYLVEHAITLKAEADDDGPF